MLTRVRSPCIPAARRPQWDHLSYSAITLFQSCPLRFYFHYVLGLPEQTITSSQLFGIAMHAAVEFYFARFLASTKLPDLDCLLDVFWSAWNEHEEQTILFSKREDISAIGRIADRMLRVFLQSDFSRPRGAIIGVEEEMRCKLVPGCPDLLARLDLIVDTDDALIVTDFKTSSKKWSPDRVSDSAIQLFLYSDLVKVLADGKPIRPGFAVMTKAQNPKLFIHPVAFDPHQVERTRLIYERVWRAIQAGHFYPNPSAMNCRTCPFREPCRKWAG